MSALLGRIPSAVGYQPTLATDMGTMQERITTTKTGSITSVQVSGPSNKTTKSSVVRFLDLLLYIGFIYLFNVGCGEQRKHGDERYPIYIDI